MTIVDKTINNYNLRYGRPIECVLAMYRGIPEHWDGGAARHDRCVQILMNIGCVLKRTSLHSNYLVIFSLALSCVLLFVLFL